MAEDLGQEDVVGHILWFEHVAADGVVSALRKWLGFQGWSREPKALEMYLGSSGLVVVLTASALAKAFAGCGFRIFLRGFNMGIVGYQIRVFLGVTELFLGVVWL
jgi:hypothetical protein